MSNSNKTLLRSLAIASAAFAAVCLFAGGIAFGVWFTQNYQIVPQDDVDRMVQQVLEQGGGVEEVLAQAGIDTRDRERLNQLLQRAGLGSLEEANALLHEGAASGAREDFGLRAPLPQTQQAGPFAFKFTPGENLRYTMQANVSGQGMEMLLPGPIAMDMQSAFDLSTQSVAPDGTGSLRLSFGDTQFRGDFMGSDFAMLQGRDGARIEMDGQALLNTAAGQGIAGIPQLAYFQDAIEMEIGPNGLVHRVTGGPGMENFLEQLPVFSSVEFPETVLAEGDQWESALNMRVPGVGAPIEATMLNTFRGYVQMKNRRVAVIDQEFVSVDKANILQMPQSALGAAFGFTMPQFDLRGNNTVYFDADNGQLVHTDMNLDLKLDIGKSLGAAGDLIGELGRGLGDLLGGLPEFEDAFPRGQQQENLLDLDLKIRSSISLVDADEA